MFTIRGPIRASHKVRDEARRLLRDYLNFMSNCDNGEGIEIEEYIRIHGSKEYNEWWDAEKERKKELREHGIIVN